MARSLGATCRRSPLARPTTDAPVRRRPRRGGLERIVNVGLGSPPPSPTTSAASADIRVYEPGPARDGRRARPAAAGWQVRAGSGPLSDGQGALRIADDGCEVRDAIPSHRLHRLVHTVQHRCLSSCGEQRTSCPPLPLVETNCLTDRQAMPVDRLRSPFPVPSSSTRLSRRSVPTKETRVRLRIRRRLSPLRREAGAVAHGLFSRWGCSNSVRTMISLQGCRSWARPG